MRQNQNDPDFAFPLVCLYLGHYFKHFPHVSSFGPPQPVPPIFLIITHSFPNQMCSVVDDLCILIHSIQNIRTYAF